MCVCVRERERENEVLCEAAELNLELSENKFVFLVHGDDYGINLRIILRDLHQLNAEYLCLSFKLTLS